MRRYTNDPRETPDVLTPLSFREAAHALAEAFAQLMEQPCDTATLACLLAQSALETGRWRKIHCNNWGNVKASSSFPGAHCYFRCNEIIKGKLEWFDPPHPQTRFRAYESAIEGAREHIRFLAKPRYAKALAAALRGDPGLFCEELKIAGYFTANLTAYAKAVTSLFREYRTELVREPLELPIAVPPEPEIPPRSALSGEDLVELISGNYLELERDIGAELAERDQRVQELDS